VGVFANCWSPSFYWCPPPSCNTTSYQSIRLEDSLYDQIRLREPFCWIAPGITDQLAMDKLGALLYYIFNVRGYTDVFKPCTDMQRVFPQVCADIARGQDLKKNASVRKDAEDGNKSEVTTKEEDDGDNDRYGPEGFEEEDADSVSSHIPYHRYSC
jgi:hypothetical protein